MKKRFLGLLLLCGCATQTDHHGYYAHDIEIIIKKIDPKQDTKISVIEKLGHPTLIDALDENIWIYAAQKNNVSSINAVKVLDLEIIRLHFDSNECLKFVERKKPSIKKSDFDKTVTPSHGYSESVVRDVFGNIGKYSFQQQ